MHWTIDYYVTTDGRCPVRNFVDGLSPEGQAKYIFITRLLTEYGVLVKEPYVKQLTGRKKLFEIRIKDKRESAGFSTSAIQERSSYCCMASQRRQTKPR